MSSTLAASAGFISLSICIGLIPFKSQKRLVQRVHDRLELSGVEYLVGVAKTYPFIDHGSRFSRSPAHGAFGESGHHFAEYVLERAILHRNLIVHDYARIDDSAVFGILKRRLGDLDEYARAIVAYLALDSEG